MPHRVRTFAAVLVVLTLLAPFSNPARAQAPAFEFTIIADSSQGFDPFEFGCVAINDAGQVAFRAVRDTGVQGIFRGSGGALTPVAEDTGEFDFLGRNPSINNAGQVSFAASLSDDGEAILRGDGGPLATVAQTDPGPFNFFGFDTSVNNGGQVAFKAELDTFDQGLFVGSGGPSATVYLTSSSPFAGNDSRPSINDAGQVAFAESLDTGGSGIFLATGTGFTTIADDSGPIGFAEEPQVNNAGVVVFHAFLDDGGEAILTGSGGPPVPVADTAGPFSSFGFGGPALNDSGQVAFSASLDDGAQGVFVGPDALADRVVGTADTIDGSAVTNVVFCREGLNNRGQLAFQAQLDDGRTVVVRATPLADDTTRPTCFVSRQIPGPPVQLQVTTQDTGSGLATIAVVQATNATVDIPAFAPGTTDPVVVTATKVDAARSSRVLLDVTDVAGNVMRCDPVVATLRIGAGGQPAPYRFGRVPKEEHFVSLVNGDPGLERVRISVNGRLFAVVALAPDETKLVDVSARMVDGMNKVSVKAYGPAAASALLVISDGVVPGHHDDGKRADSLLGIGSGAAGINLDWGTGRDQ